MEKDIMRAIKKAKRIIEKDPSQPFAKFLTDLVLSLESNNEFPTRQLYELSVEDFDFALQILKEWRIDRHYMGKAKTFDAAYHAHDTVALKK
jgi:hypothetical protein